ncbi:MAG: hypothetical protein HFE63_10195 [Clostridiales bacterium]|nr:hypothetical protein [Clostridiales bacterium]
MTKKFVSYSLLAAMLAGALVSCSDKNNPIDTPPPAKFRCRICRHEP